MVANHNRKADMILKNGCVWTVDDQFPQAQAVAIQGNEILAVGSDEEMDSLRGPGTRVYDLESRLVLPGFNDSHTHFIMASLEFEGSFDLNGVSSLQEVQARLKEFSANNPENEWIYGARWIPSRIGDGSWPNKADLDRIESDRPVAIGEVDHHSYWVNSAGLRALGYHAGTPDPVGGKIMRDESGEPTGILLENAFPITGHDFQVSSSVFNRILTRDIARFHQIGLTSMTNNITEKKYMDMLHAMAKDHSLKMRVNYWPWLLDGMDRVLEEYHTYQVQDLLQVVGVKSILDGVLSSYTGWMLEEYSDQAGAFGFPVVPPEDLLPFAYQADAAGLQIVIHAIGDRGVREALNIYQACAAKYPLRDRRHRVEHVEVAHPADQQRFVQLGVIPSMTPVHCTKDLKGYIISRLGEPRGANGYAWRNFLDLGLPLAFGTDWPATDLSTPNPLEMIFAAVTRTKPESIHEEIWHPEQRITPAEAIRCYTLNSAYAEFTEKRKGSITPGKLADLVVLSKNILEVNPLEILDTRVDMTFFGGELVFVRN